MIKSLSYLETVREILDREFPGDKVWPADLIWQWEELVEECECGYTWDISEYHHEMYSRRLLQHLLDSNALLDFPERAELERSVSEIDSRFRTLLQSDMELKDRKWWWERGVLKRAGNNYVEYLKKAYDIHVELM
jgi:hypothetical protein